MAYDQTKRIQQITEEKAQLIEFQTLLTLPTLIENRLSSLYVKLSKSGDHYKFGDISILNVSDSDGGATDRRKNASITTLVNDEITINQTDTTYLYDGFIYSVTMTFPENGYPYYVLANGAVIAVLPPTYSKTDFYAQYIISEIPTILDANNSQKIREGLSIIIEDMIYFTSERDADGTIKKVSNEVVLSIKGILNYINSSLDNLDQELTKLLLPIPTITSKEEGIADLFDLKATFEDENTRYAGMIGHLWVGFALYVENQELPAGISETIKTADVEKLNDIYPNWRDVVNVETLRKVELLDNELHLIDPDSLTDEEIELYYTDRATRHYYEVYRLDYDKAMSLAPMIIVPLLFQFMTMRSEEIERCEFDSFVTFIIMAILTYYGAKEAAAYLSTYMFMVYIALNFVVLSGAGGDDVQLFAKIALLFLSVNSAYNSMSSNGAGALSTLGFSVQLTSSTFDLYAEYDLGKEQKKLDESAEKVEKLEEELDLALQQDEITDYIFDKQYTDMYDSFYENMYDTESDLYMGSFS